MKRPGSIIAAAAAALLLLAGCLEVTEDNTRDTSLLIAASNGTSSTMSFTAGASGYYAYSYNCFSYTYNSIFNDTGWNITFGYPFSRQRDIIIFIKEDPIVPPKTYIQTALPFRFRIWLNATDSYNLDPGMGFSLTITQWGPTRVIGTFSGTLLKDGVTPLNFTLGTFDACVRPR